MVQLKFNVELADNGIILRGKEDSDIVSVTEYGNSYNGTETDYTPAYKAIGEVVYEKLLECKTSDDRYIIGYDVAIDIKPVTKKKRQLL